MSHRRRKIDHLVDGELDRAGERQLLLDCESNNRWRELALAFVESRALEKELRGILADDTLPPSQTAVTNARPSRLVRPNKKVSEASPAESRVPRRLSLAAAILISLSLGYAAGSFWQHAAMPNNFAQHPTERGGTHIDRPRSMQFIVNHPNSQELQQIEIPILNAKDLGPDWQQRLQANSWDGLVEKMRREGLNLRQQRTLTPVRLSNGQRVVVPVDYFYEQPYQ